MPVIVVGADTAPGSRIVRALVDGAREVRAFVSDPEAAMDLRAIGVKVATGDVSDASHVQGACTNAFSAVLVTEASADQRERSFAPTPRQVQEGWAQAVSEAGVTRVIWVDAGDPPRTAASEEVVVDPTSADLVTRVCALDDAASIPPRE